MYVAIATYIVTSYDIHSVNGVVTNMSIVLSGTGSVSHVTLMSFTIKEPSKDRYWYNIYAVIITDKIYSICLCETSYIISQLTKKLKSINFSLSFKVCGTLY